MSAVSPDTLAAAGAADAITFTSASTVQNFVAAAGAEAARSVRAISIGPVTTATARSLDVDVAAQAREYTIDGVVRAVVEMCETELTPPPKQ